MVEKMQMLRRQKCIESKLTGTYSEKSKEIKRSKYLSRGDLNEP